MINKDKGGVTMAVFQSLEAFWPGLLVIHLFVFKYLFMY